MFRWTFIERLRCNCTIIIMHNAVKPCKSHEQWKKYFVLTFSLLYSLCTCTLHIQLLYSSAWIRHLSIVLKCNVIPCLKSQTRSLESENTSEKGKASVLLSAVMTFSFLFSPSYASHIYAVCLFVHCLPSRIWNANNLLGARNILFFLSAFPSPFSFAHICLAATLSLCMHFLVVPRMHHVQLSVSLLCHSRSKFYFTYTSEQWKEL